MHLVLKCPNDFKMQRRKQKLLITTFGLLSSQTSASLTIAYLLYSLFTLVFHRERERCSFLYISRRHWGPPRFSRYNITGCCSVSWKTEANLHFLYWPKEIRTHNLFHIVSYYACHCPLNLPKFNGVNYQQHYPSPVSVAQTMMSRLLCFFPSRCRQCFQLLTFDIGYGDSGYPVVLQVSRQDEVCLLGVGTCFHSYSWLIITRIAINPGECAHDA